MTSFPSLVRLVPGKGAGDRVGMYVAEYKCPEDMEWTRVGIVEIIDDEYRWIPAEKVNGFESIDISYRELCLVGGKFDPKLFARYKLGKYVMEILRGEWPGGGIVPTALS